MGSGKGFEEMKKKDRQERELKENMINLAVRKNWWKFVQSVESIRHSPDDRVAIFWLGTSTSVSYRSQP